MAYAPPTHTHNTRAYNSILLERPLTTGEMRANVSWRARRWAGLMKLCTFVLYFRWFLHDPPPVGGGTPLSPCGGEGPALARSHLWAGCVRVRFLSIS